MRYYKLLTKHRYSRDLWVVGKIYSELFSPTKNGVSVDYIVNKDKDSWIEVTEKEYLEQEGIIEDSSNIKSYYKGKNSLYQFAEEHELNSYEFDIIKRIVRCRFKGNWLDDLEKTKGVIDIYIKERKEKYNG